MNQEPTPEIIEKIGEAILQGRKIEAIKIYREYSGAGLAEAKEMVEKISADLRQKFPEKFKEEPKGKGCFGLVVFLIIVASALGVVFF